MVADRIATAPFPAPKDILTLQKETSRVVRCGNSHTNGGRNSRSELFRSERRLRKGQKGLQASTGEIPL